MDYHKLQHPEFVKEALKTKVLHLKPSDFTVVKFKKELQYLFRLFYFPNFDFASLPSRIDITRLNQNIDKLKSMNRRNFDLVYNYPFQGGGGFGPGEVLLYLLTEGTHLGGSRSAGADLIGTKDYEIKAARISTDNFASNFKLGSGLPSDVEIITRLVELSKEYKVSGVTSRSISVNAIKDIKRKAGKQFNEIESRYAAEAVSYFNKDVIFINNNDSTKKGMIEAIKRPIARDVTIQVVTESRIKPMIRL